MSTSNTYRHRIVIKTRAAGEDAAGQPLTTWVEFTRRWSNILTVNGKAAITADAQTATVKTSFRVRWCTDLLPGMRVEHGGAAYDVLQVLPDLQRREHVDLVCEEVKPWA